MLGSEGLSSGYHAHGQDSGSAITVAEYTKAIDTIASRLTRSDFARHFDSVAGNGFRFRLKYVKGGGIQSSLKALLDYDTNLKAKKAVDAQVYRFWVLQCTIVQYDSFADREFP